MDEKRAELVNASKLRVLRLYYEDALEDEEAYMKQLLEFLGLPWEDWRARMATNSSKVKSKKATRDSLRDAIQNWHDVEEAFSMTRFAAQLYE